MREGRGDGWEFGSFGERYTRVRERWCKMIVVEEFIFNSHYMIGPSEVYI